MLLADVLYNEAALFYFMEVRTVALHLFLFITVFWHVSSYRIVWYPGYNLKRNIASAIDPYDTAGSPVLKFYKQRIIPKRFIFPPCSLHSFFSYAIPRAGNTDTLRWCHYDIK